MLESGFAVLEVVSPRAAQLAPDTLRCTSVTRIDPTVASHDSALKAHRQNVKRRDHNRQLRTRLRGALRDIRAAIDSGDPKNVTTALRQTISMVDKMASKGLIHRNTAGRYKSRLAGRVAKRTAAA